MSASRYLKEESYYNDRYDLFTIQECLRLVEYWRKAFKTQENSKELKALPAKEKSKHFSSALNLHLYFIKGENYKRKASTIQEWVEKDRRCDEKLGNAQVPQDITCPQCSHKMDLIFKDLYDTDSLRVLFFFECPACKKRKGYFDNGEMFVSRPEHCPKCKSEIKVRYVKDGRISKWIRSCKSCGFRETEVDDIDKERAARLEREAGERELLKKHRAEFCSSSEEGQEYIESANRLEMLSGLLEKDKQKKSDPDYRKVARIKKLSVVELEKLISETIVKEKYIKLMLEKPEIDRFVIVPFTAQDADSSRKEYDSVRKLHRIIKKIFEGTNWRLMSEGVQYRLGYLSGRLKGYEHEEDLLLLVKGRNKNKLEGEHDSNQKTQNRLG